MQTRQVKKSAPINFDARYVLVDVYSLVRSMRSMRVAWAIGNYWDVKLVSKDVHVACSCLSKEHWSGASDVQYT